ncbi:MAG TPA: hypothetical protein VGL58_18025 [Caulobacteraceae bacterium]|jgi:hypothetical protein
MTTRTPALLAAAAALALPLAGLAASPAMASPAMDAFKTVCWTPANDYVSVLKAADAAGWSNTQLMPEIQDNVSVTDQGAREKDDSDGKYTLLVSRGLRHSSGGDVKEADCKVSFDKADPGLLAEAQSWIGVAPDAAPDATLATYFVKPVPGKPQHIAQADLNTALGAGGFAVLKFQVDANAVTLVYQTFAK